jgi:tRNA threonylcarbamoyladenosine biosynthesis protein TsaE
MRDELTEILADPQAVVAVEWANIVEDVLPADKLTISIKVTSDSSRKLQIEYPESLKYLIPKNA